MKPLLPQFTLVISAWLYLILLWSLEWIILLLSLLDDQRLDLLVFCTVPVVQVILAHCQLDYCGVDFQISSGYCWTLGFCQLQSQLPSKNHTKLYNVGEGLVDFTLHFLPQLLLQCNPQHHYVYLGQCYLHLVVLQHCYLGPHHHHFSLHQSNS